MATRLSYTPEPYEQAYYDHLFATADTQRAGSIGGGQAVQFFSRSKLPVDSLKQIWTLADSPPANALDQPKFYVAVRLIQLQQNGVRAQGTNLAPPPGTTLRPVFFEGMPPAPQSPQQQQQQQQAPPSPRPQQQRQQQQMQAPPSPRPQQPPMQQQHPTTPPRPPMQQQQQQQQQQRPPSSMALTAQDPYTLTPSEQSMYEGVFAEYTKPDGYVYGPEAVALFGKSGTPQPTLAAIWNMCDWPVDNRLDKLEFCLAMHLIVCVSKKHLPLPPSLPLSLKQLKSQQAAAASVASGSVGMPSPPSMQQGQPPPPMQQQPPTMQLGGGSVGGGSMQGPPPIQPSPSMTMQQQQQQPASSGSVMSGPPPIQPSPSGLSGPPLLQQQGGLSISDAFEGLSAADSGANYMQSTPLPPPNKVPTSVTIETAPEPAPSSIPEPTVSSMAPPTETTSTRAVAPESAPKSASQLASSYDMGDAHEELSKLKAVLQKLQAENISLKAQVGTLSEDEKDVQKQLGATVTEIGKLSNELTTLRAQVLAAKSRLLEATAELKAAEEKKGVITDLITEAKATKEAIDEAYMGVENANEQIRSAPPPPAPSNAFDGDLFGFDAALAPEPEPATSYQPQSYDSQPESTPPVVQSPSYDSYSAPNPAPAAMQSAPAPAPAATQSAPVPAPAVTQSPSYDYGEKPAAVQGHQRAVSTVSVGFDAGDIMGGAPGPLPGGDSYALSATSTEAQPGAPAYNGGGGGYDAGSAPSVENVEELKRKAKEAASLAQDAEESRRQLMASVDELRRVADQAEAAARKNRESHDKGTKKKGKGFMGRGKKRDQKETERLEADAKAKKERFLEAQSQANDAQAVAMETKREAEKLRREAEEAEVHAASAASMQHSQPPPEAQPQQANGYPTQTDTTDQDKSYGGFQGAYGGGFQGQQPDGGGYGGGFQGQQSDGGAYGGGFQGQPYNPNVMGAGGGVSIPTPSGTDDPFSNPFE